MAFLDDCTGDGNADTINLRALPSIGIVYQVEEVWRESKLVEGGIAR